MMERLTDKKEADAQRQEYENRLKNGYPRNTPEERFLKLAAYEDTRLEPEEIKTIIERYHAFRSAISDETGQPMVSWTRAGEICRAEKDGRLVVLPCKPGQMVWAESPVRGRAYSFKALDITWIIENTERFGREIFLTREEAEVALKKREEADDGQN